MKEDVADKMVIISILVLIVVILMNIINSSGIYNVHYKDDNYCFVLVYTGSGKSQNTYSGTMSCEDYERWVNGDNGTVFIYTDNEAKYGYRINISSITQISNYGDTPYAYD